MRCHRFSAEAIANALDGRPSGEGWVACCPAHDDTTPSLSINETSAGKVLVKCFARLPAGGRHCSPAETRSLGDPSRQNTAH